MESPPARAVFVGVASTAVGIVAMAMFETATVAIRDDFGVSTQTVVNATAVNTTASVLLVFVAAMLSRRYDWYVLTRILAVLNLGALLVAAAAPNLAILTAARSTLAVGAGMLMVTGLGILQRGFPDGPSRARVLGWVSAAQPAAYLIAPLIAGVVVDTISWRAIPVAIATGIVIVGAASLRLPPLGSGGVGQGADTSRRMEWRTPLLGGIALAAFVGVIVCFPLSQIGALACAVLAIILTVVTILLWRRSPDPGLDISIFRLPAMGWVVAAAALSGLVNVSLFATVWLRSQSGVTSTMAAVILIVPQLAGVVAGLLGGRLAGRFGPYPVAIAGTLVAAVGGFMFVTMDANDLAVFVAAVTGLTLAGMLGAAGPITQIFLERVPPSGQGAAAAWRSATRSVALAVGAVLVVTLAYTIYRGSLQLTLENEGVPTATAAAVAADLQDRVSAGVITATYQLPAAIVEDLSVDNPALRQTARSDAMGAMGIFTVVTSLLAVVALAMAYRRRRVDS